MYESSTKETKWVCIQLACSRRSRAFEEAHSWNIQAKFYNEKFPLVYKSDKTRDFLSWRSWCYFEHKCGKKDSSIVPFFIWPFFFLFFFWDNALLMMIITLLFIYNSKITTRYMNASGGVPGYAMNQEWHVWKNYEWWLCHKYDVNYMIMLEIWQWWSVS